MKLRSKLPSHLGGPVSDAGIVPGSLQNVNRFLRYSSLKLAFHVLIQEASQVELAEPPPDVTVTTDACRYGVLINLMWPLE
jgi:hypothetical protein